MEAAGYVELHHKTLRRAIGRGILAATQRSSRANGRWFVLHSDLMAWAFPNPTAEQAAPPSKRQRKRRVQSATVDAHQGLIGERFDLATLLAYGESTGSAVAA